ncbi:hypothetical protein HMPREF3156_00971 [Neisseria sp. HMSC06F02]|nr:hypothetical protein HMPREF3156_00971 [Neisseria sp. HMSC06F02]
MARINTNCSSFELERSSEHFQTTFLLFGLGKFNHYLQYEIHQNAIPLLGPSLSLHQNVLKSAFKNRCFLPISSLWTLLNNLQTSSSDSPAVLIPL